MESVRLCGGVFSPKRPIFLPESIIGSISGLSVSGLLGHSVAKHIFMAVFCTTWNFCNCVVPKLQQVGAAYSNKGRLKD